MTLAVQFKAPRGWTPRWARMFGPRWGVVLMTSPTHWMLGVEGLTPGLGIALGPVYIGLGVCEEA